jgi:hypothetical protein
MADVPLRGAQPLVDLQAIFADKVRDDCVVVAD